MRPTKDIALEIAHNFKTTDGWTVVVYKKQTLEDAITAALDVERSRVEGLMEEIDAARKMRDDFHTNSGQLGLNLNSLGAYDEARKQNEKKFRGEG